MLAPSLRAAHLGLALALVASLLTQSCSSVSTEPAPSNELNERLAELICAKKANCCAQSYDGDLARCLAIEKLSASTRAKRIEDAVQSGSASYDDVRFDDCLAKLSVLTCDEWYAAAAGALPAACVGYTRGNRVVGAPCRDYFECASGHCAYTPSGEGRTCQAQGVAGAACQGADDECALAMQCWGGACVRRLPADSACTEHGQCGSGDCRAGACVGACKLDSL